jgi:osmoprotectant transport system permease protein
MRRWVVLIILLVILTGLTVWTTSLGRIGTSIAFTYGDILSATRAHLLLVFVPVLAATVIIMPLGILITRPQFNRFAPGVIGAGNIGQSLPSLAVIAIMVPLIGFGLESAFIALFIYGLLPILRNSYAGMNNIDTAVIEAARGMGMTRWQILRKIELPLARPVIMTGIRISTIITVGTAELAALIGVYSLGGITLAGVVAGEPLIIVQGAAPTAFLAIVLGFLLELMESRMTPKGLKIAAKTA